jgi:hypothetical protein
MTMPEHGRQNTRPVALALLLAMVAGLAAPRAGAAQSALIPRVNRPPTLKDFLGMKPPADLAPQLFKITGLVQRDPKDGDPVSQPTEVYLGYDEKNLYAIFVCFDAEPAKVRAHLTRREAIFDDDLVGIFFDTFKDHRRAYEFLTNPLGVQADAIITEGQNDDFSFDTLWYSEGKLTPQGYVVWIAIPFKSLRFKKEDMQSWGFGVARVVQRNNEFSFWPHVTRKVEGFTQQLGDLEGMRQISPGRNMQFIPYGISRTFRELDTRDSLNPGFSQAQMRARIGLDAKFILKDSFVLDVTANPDFSQVESDEPQITANQRFEVFFPEKRPFFLENSSYFQTPIQLLFTRRIGDPKAGIRLTGKKGPYSVGILAVDDVSPGHLVPDNDPIAGKRGYFTIARVAYDLFSQSWIGLMYSGREFNDRVPAAYSCTLSDFQCASYNRVGGIDGRFKLNTNWVLNFQGVASSTRRLDGTTMGGPAYEGELYRQSRKLFLDFGYTDRSDGFRTLAGFDPQPDIRAYNQFFNYKFRPEGKRLISWGPSMRTYRIQDHQGNRLNWGFQPQMQAEFARQTYASVGYAEEGELLRPRDFSVLTSNKDFTRNTKTVNFSTRYFKWAGLDVDYRWGTRINYDPPTGVEQFLARRNSLNLLLNLKPVKALDITNTYLLLRLANINGGPGAFNNHILRSKWNYQLTRELSLRVITQYNAVLTSPSFTSLPTTKNLNFDFLITYLLHPGTAVYVGYNSNLENLDPALCARLPGGGCDPNNTALLRTRNQFINDGRLFFVKASYLFRF